MRHIPNWKRFHILLAGAIVAAAALPAVVDARGGSTDLYVPKGNADSKQQIVDLRKSKQNDVAKAVKSMVDTPQAVWFTQGTPDETRKVVHKTVNAAADDGSTPVIVAYNIPFRDCAQFSAGGATTPAEYRAWIDGFAAGIGDLEAIVILEPDGLGIIPWYTNSDGQLEWCQPDEADSDTADDERFAMLNYAVDTLGASGNVDVYLDGTHSAWLNVGDIATRLLDAGVDRAAGFYLNASNYQYTDNLVQYGSWISGCIEILSGDGEPADCPNQYWNGGPDGTLIADLRGPWDGVALDPMDTWSDTSPDDELNTSGINRRYADAGVDATTEFIVDTSRNGQGPWAPEPGAYPDGVDVQDWCNPPDRGLGERPTLDTGHELVAAYLWIKIPGESDGECTRGLGGVGTVDPEWGIVDPPAGAWFPDMVLDLIENAEPAVMP